MTSITKAPVFKLSPTVQKYDWGKIGSQSKVAQLAKAGNGSFQLDDAAPYAELWMGTHSTSPSHVHGSDVQLKEHLSTNHHLIGPKVRDNFKAHDGDVPFLFKVLSIAKALSIQTHPDKATAERLHAEQPHIYKDHNHKPEMAIALTPFTALCGFRPLPQIADFICNTPEFAKLIPAGIASKFVALASASSPASTTPTQEDRTALRDVFAAVMTAEDSLVKEQLTALAERYRSSGAGPGEDEDVASLVLTLTVQFPGDIGIFCAFLLNYVKLQPGEAIFLGAGEPHAYVSGDIMECMATSDNVIRAGLTPKLRDIPNLVSGLTYIASDPSKHVVNPTPFSAHSKLYDPPIPEFAVIQTQLSSAENDEHRAVEGPSIAAVVDGKGVVRWADRSLDVAMGDVVYLGADTPVTLEAAESGLTVYRAFVEV